MKTRLQLNAKAQRREEKTAPYIHKVSLIKNFMSFAPSRLRVEFYQSLRYFEHKGSAL